MSGSDGSCGSSRNRRPERIARETPVSVDTVVFVDEHGNDIAYLCAVMEREREHTTVIVTEEMIIKNDSIKRWQRRAQTASGEHITREQRFRPRRQQDQ